jgi:peptidoglycan/LPS O-acetylase OafA/YrhL
MTLDFGNSKMPPVRAILALIIVLGHFSFFGVESLVPLRNLAPPAVAMFLFISGYGLTRSFKMKGNTYLGGFFRKRMVKILFPAILVAGLHSLLCGGSGAGIGERVQRIVTGGNTYLPHYWFVWAIVFDYLLFWVCHKLFRNPVAKYSILAGVILFTLTTAHAGFDRCWWICSLAFPTGVFFAEYETPLFTFCSKKEVYYWLTLFVFAIAFVVCYLTRNPAIWTLCYVFIPIIVALIIARIPLGRFRLRVLCFVGSVSYEIYLIHITVMNFLRGNNIYLSSDLVFVAAVLCITIGTAYGIHFLDRIITPKTN